MKKLELQLLRWAQSSNGGMTVTFALADEDALNYFKQHTLRKGKLAGQLYAAGFVLVDGQEELEEPPESTSTIESASMKLEVPTPTASELHGAEERYSEPGADSKSQGKRLEKQRKEAGRRWYSQPPLTQKANALCKQDRFWDFVIYKRGLQNLVYEIPTIEKARKYIINFCNIDSRKDLNPENPEACKKFKQLEREFEKWCENDATKK